MILRVLKNKKGLISLILICTYMVLSSISYGQGDSYLYDSLSITGNMIGEHQVYSIKDFKELSSLENLDIKQDNKIKVISFLELCGLDKDASDNTVVQVFNTNKTVPIATYALKEIKEFSPLIDSELQFKLLIKDKEIPIKKIMVSKKDKIEDPWYQHHNRSYYKDMKDIEFTVNVYDNSDVSEKKSPVKTKTFTTQEIEKIMMDNPDHIVGNYYGTIGNKESISTMGIGGWIDYFEGIDLWWLLKEKLDLPEVSGSAIYYDRDGKEYTRTSMSYLQNKDHENDKYTVITRDSEEIKGSIPILATSKNGYPLLPEHDHDHIAYKDYNKLNDNLKLSGIETKIGLVKNHSGPFIAGLGNLQGEYGGYRVQTGGDCTQIDLHLDLADKVTRAELVKVLAEMSGEDLSKYTKSNFTDVSDQWFLKYVVWANEKGITFGSDGKFNPNDIISRQDMSVMIYRYNKIINKSELIKKESIRVFSDDNHISNYAREPISALQQAKIILVAEDNLFSPRNGVNKLEVEKMLASLINKN